jgi:hypothetical protein
MLCVGKIKYGVPEAERTGIDWFVESEYGCRNALIVLLHAAILFGRSRRIEFLPTKE